MLSREGAGGGKRTGLDLVSPAGLRAKQGRRKRK